MKMLKRPITILILLLFSSLLFAQNTLVRGKITGNNPTINAIDLQVNHRFLDGNIDTYESNILEDGSFAFAVQINEPQTVNLLYARNNALLYLEPNDTLFVNFDADSFKFSFDFSGRSGENNAYLSSYLEKYPFELNPFKYLQYRSGPYWYRIDPDIDYAMRSKTKEAFTQQINKNRATELANLGFFVQNSPNLLTEDFKEFMRAEIYYNWAYHQLFFGDVYKGMHGIEESYFDFLKDVPLQNDQIGSHWYRTFLLAYINRIYVKQDQVTENPYATQYKIAEEQLSSKAMAFMQSELLSIAFYKKYIDTTIPIYDDFVENNAYPLFDDKAIYAYQKAMKTAVGTPAPEFVVPTENAKDLRLSDLQGKVVFLNFWATWCRPCVKKMEEMKLVQTELGNEIEFVHVSFDSDTAKWDQYITDKNYEGTHLLAPAGIHSAIAKQFEVKALPQYFIIDKEGNFAEKPLTFTIENVIASLKYANR